MKRGKQGDRIRTLAKSFIVQIQNNLPYNNTIRNIEFKNDTHS